MSRRSKRKTRHRARSLEFDPSGVTFWLVGFLDLLGYKSILQGFDTDDFPEPDRSADFLASFAKAIRLRRRLHVGIRVMTEGQGTAPDVDLSSAPPEARRVIQDSRKIQMITAPGPDHMLLACSLAPRPDHSPMRATFTLFSAAAAASMIQLALGADEPDDTRPIRGGIDLAPGAVLEPEHYLFSPASMRAYQLETDAVFPRILIGERVMSLLEGYLAVEDESDFLQRYSQFLAQRLKGRHLRLSRSR
jgi:hypothetical protein